MTDPIYTEEDLAAAEAELAEVDVDDEEVAEEDMEEDPDDDEEEEPKP